MSFPIHYLYLAAAIVLEVIGTAFLKQSNGFRETIPTLITAVSYAGAFYLMSLTLKAMPVGIVYAIWSGVGIVLIALVGWVVFRQGARCAGFAWHGADNRRCHCHQHMVARARALRT